MLRHDLASLVPPHHRWRLLSNQRPDCQACASRLPSRGTSLVEQFVDFFAENEGNVPQ
jgi:hypothetical protein